MSAAEGWFVYLLACADGSFYCGITSELQRRLKQHNGLLAGGAKYTRGRRPVALHGWIQCATKSDAMRKEIHVKRLSREQKMSFFAREGSNAAS